MKSKVFCLSAISITICCLLCGCERHGDSDRDGQYPASNYGVTDPAAAALVVVSTTERRGKLSLDGQDVGWIEPNTQVVFTITPGSHRLCASTFGDGTQIGAGGLNEDFNVSAGRAIVYELHRTCLIRPEDVLQ